jgi:ATP-dependent Clp protease ATP-binding subunit ClpC
MGHSYVGSEHLLLGLLIEGEGVGAHVLKDLGVTLKKVRERIGSEVADIEESKPTPPLAPEISQVLDAATTLAVREGAAAVTLDHLRRAMSG